MKKDEKPVGLPVRIMFDTPGGGAALRFFDTESGQFLAAVAPRGMLAAIEAGDCVTFDAPDPERLGVITGTIPRAAFDRDERSYINDTLKTIGRENRSVTAIFGGYGRAVQLLAAAGFHLKSVFGLAAETKKPAARPAPPSMEI
jgi:hypothetical protein